MTDNEKLLERLAALEHRQWMHWANHIKEQEDLSEERTERWEEAMVPYEELTGEMKEKDRKWARKVIGILEDEDVWD